MNKQQQKEFVEGLLNPLQYRRNLLKNLTVYIKEKTGGCPKLYRSVEEFTKDVKNVAPNSIIIIDEMAESIFPRMKEQKESQFRELVLWHHSAVHNKDLWYIKHEVHNLCFTKKKVFDAINMLYEKTRSTIDDNTHALVVLDQLIRELKK